MHIEQYRNGLGRPTVCCKWHHQIFSFRVTREILVQILNMYLPRAGNHGAAITYKLLSSEWIIFIFFYIVNMCSF